MSTYQGRVPEKGPYNQADIQVMVDGQPLPSAQADVPEAGNVFGWGNFSPRANKKLLAYSILIHELHNVIGLPTSMAHRVAFDIGDRFADERVFKFDRRWSLTSEEISQWIKETYPEKWRELSSHQAPA